jgi:hypothetical protein
MKATTNANNFVPEVTKLGVSVGNRHSQPTRRGGVYPGRVPYKRKRKTPQAEEESSALGSQSRKYRAIESDANGVPGGSKDNPVFLSDDDNNQGDGTPLPTSPALSAATVQDSDEDRQAIEDMLQARIRARAERTNTELQPDTDTANSAMGSTPPQHQHPNAPCTDIGSAANTMPDDTHNTDELSCTASPVSSVPPTLPKSVTKSCMRIGDMITADTK